MTDLLLTLLIIGPPALATFMWGQAVGRSRQMQDELDFHKQRGTGR